MIYRAATPADGLEMLQLIEAEPTAGGMQLLYTRRPDAYSSYHTECADAELMVSTDDQGHIVAQAACLPRRLYLEGEIHTVGYLTGLRKVEGRMVNFVRMMQEARMRSSAKAFFCSILNSNQPVLDMFAKRGFLSEMRKYTTYFFNPRAIKPRRQTARQPTCRRATSSDASQLLRFYQEEGAKYSYFPVISDINGFSGLTITDFLLLEESGEIIAAGALWNQRSFKQYIACGYRGPYALAARCNPVLRLLNYPPLPTKNTPANFAYVSFLLWRRDYPAESLLPKSGSISAKTPDLPRIMLQELAKTAQDFDFLTVGAVQGDEVDTIMGKTKSIKIGSTLCMIDHEESGVPQVSQTPLKFECALL